MFLGHLAVAFGGKRLAPAASLGTLVIASQLADLLWPNLVLLGVERLEIEPGATAVTPLDFVSYPFSHSLVALGLWAALFGGGYWLVRRQGVAAPLVLAFLVVSHWALDVLSHRPDVPLTLGSGHRFGLGLWYSLPATAAVEVSLFTIGIAVYVGATRPRDRVGSLALWSLVAFLLLVYGASLLGPPPPGSAAVAWTAQATWLLVLWAYWADGHRIPRTADRRTLPS